jgi:hypothetical protein
VVERCDAGFAADHESGLGDHLVWVEPMSSWRFPSAEEETKERSGSQATNKVGKNVSTTSGANDTSSVR